MLNIYMETFSYRNEIRVKTTTVTVCRVRNVWNWKSGFI